MRYYIFDTSFLIALIKLDDSNHDKAIDITNQFDLSNTQFLINPLIYGETLTVFKNRGISDRIYVYDLFLLQIKTKSIACNFEEYHSACKSSITKMSVCDWSVVCDAKRYDAIPLTFDEELMVQYLK